MKTLPEGWELAKISDIANILSGGTPRRNVQEYWKEGNINWLKISDLKNTYITQAEEKITQEGLNNSSAKIFSKGTVVYSIFATLGAVGILDIPAATNQAIAGIIPNNSLIDTKYLYYCLQSEKNKIIAKKSHATQDNINLTILRNHEIPLPPLSTQKKIAAILEKAERLKEWRKEADRLTDEFLKSTFLEMFGDPVKNPKGWEKKKLKEFGEVKTGNTPSRKKPEYYGNYIEWIKSDNINTPNTYLTKSEEMLSELGIKIGRTAPKGSVLVTCIAGSLSCIGNIAIADRNVAFNQQINAIIPNNKANEFFIYHLILNSKSYIQNYSTKSMKGMVSKSLFESLPFIFPPIDLQNRFGAIAKDFESLKNYQTQSKQQIDDLFNALMQQAFKGELAC